MPEVALFCEDSFHERFVGSLVSRLARERRVDVKARFYSARGGLPRMQAEFPYFLRDLYRDRRGVPDCIVVVADANCLGHAARKEQFDGVLGHFPAFQQIVGYAIPDPHIERWMLVDPNAFQAVFGRGCTLPVVKCAKDKYKNLLRREMREAGVDSPLGGEEYAEDIVNSMDLARAEIQEPSLGRFLHDIRARLNAWSQG